MPDRYRSFIAAAASVAVLAVSAPGASAYVEWEAPPGTSTAGDHHIEYPRWNQTGNFANPGAISAGRVGDVNGDGLEDVGAFIQGYGTQVDSAYVTFMKPEGGSGPVSSFGGFRIYGMEIYNGLGPAGDVNGDGLGDVMIPHWDQISVVFGRTDGAAVNVDALGNDGFVIQNAGGPASQLGNAGLHTLGDVNGDGVPDLLVRRHRDASIIYPPRAAAGITIDGGTAGPNASLLNASGAREILSPYIDTLGDIDGDGRTDVLFGGEETSGTDSAIYGVVTPQPGTTVEMPAAVDQGKAFEIRGTFGEDGWFAEVEWVSSAADQNRDGRRDVILSLQSGRLGRVAKVIYGVAPGNRVDVTDLAASDSRGYSVPVYGSGVDVGDQNGDGIGDLATRNYVRYSDPPREQGNREFGAAPSTSLSGSYEGEIRGTIGDSSGDGAPEILLPSVHTVRNSGYTAVSEDYALDIYDSVRPPAAAQPEVPVVRPDGKVEVAAQVDSGAGVRGATRVPYRVQVEASPNGGPFKVVGLGGPTASASPSNRAVLVIDPQNFAAGKPYRLRVRVQNSRDLWGTSAERDFVYPSPVQPPARQTGPIVRRGTRGRDRLIGTNAAERLLGLGGNDTLDGRGGKDTVDGGDGNDKVLGASGNDKLIGGKGNDTLTGGTGKDSFDAGPGKDTVNAADGVAEVVNCGSGRDKVVADNKDKLRGCESRRIKKVRR